MNNDTTKTYTDDMGALYKAVARLKTEADCRAFFEDICSLKELHAMAQRLQVASLLNEGKSFVQITEETGASTATISRVSRCLSNGSGGYKQVL